MVDGGLSTYTMFVGVGMSVSRTSATLHLERCNPKLRPCGFMISAVLSSWSLRLLLGK